MKWYQKRYRLVTVRDDGLVMPMPLFWEYFTERQARLQCAHLNVIRMQISKGGWKWRVWDRKTQRYLTP